MKQNTKIIIKSDPDCEMMSINVDDDCVFYGNEWDFKRDPTGLAKFLKKLKFDVEIVDASYEDGTL